MYLESLQNVYLRIILGRFTSICEEIPDLKTEKCYNSLSKSGCLSVQNPDFVCVWKNDECTSLGTS